MLALSAAAFLTPLMLPGWLMPAATIWLMRRRRPLPIRAAWATSW
jgi:hypothetical protein